MTLLALDQVSRAPVREVSLELAAGERLALVGPGGDVLLSMIAGRLRPTAGRIRLGDDDITHAGERAIRHLGVGHTVRSSGGFASMTVRESVQLALLVTRNQASSWWRPTMRRHRSQADHLLDRVGLLAHAERGTERLDLPARRRLDLALAVAHRPRLILLDDPAADLPPDHAAALLDLIRHLAAADDAAVVLATGDSLCAIHWADRILVTDALFGVPPANSSPSRCSPDPEALD